MMNVSAQVALVREYLARNKYWEQRHETIFVTRKMDLATVILNAIIAS